MGNLRRIWVALLFPVLFVGLFSFGKYMDEQRPKNDVTYITTTDAPGVYTVAPSDAKAWHYTNTNEAGRWFNVVAFFTFWAGVALLFLEFLNVPKLSRGRLNNCMLILFAIWFNCKAWAHSIAQKETAVTLTEVQFQAAINAPGGLDALFTNPNPS